MATLGELGEFKFIERIAAMAPSASTVVEGLGDDCAVLKFGDHHVLISTDLFIENVHFRRGASKPEDIGWKGVATGLSDIAAMGGIPTTMLIALAAPPDFDSDELERIYRGIVEAAEAYDTAIVGGDITRSDGGLTMDVTVLGESSCLRYLLRKGAQKGDAIAVTGYPGMSAAGLHAQENAVHAPTLLQVHHRPVPRIRPGQWLCAHDSVRAMLDVSDGLVQDTGHLAKAAALGVDIDSSFITIHPDLAQYCDDQSLNALDLALSGGEDYELLCAIDPGHAPSLSTAFEHEFAFPLTIIGSFNDANHGVRVDGSTLERGGFDHFA